MNDRSADKESQERREFLKKAAKMTVAAPAVALLMSAGLKPVYAQSYTQPTTTQFVSP